MRLTAKTFDRVIAGPPAEVRDAACPGLVLRVRSASWKWEIRWSPGRGFKHKRIDLGTGLRLEDARELANKFREVARAYSEAGPDDVLTSFASHLRRWRERKQGIMPPLRVPKPAPPPSISYRAAVEMWREELMRTRRERTAKEYAYALTGKELQPWLDRYVRDIKRVDAAKIVLAIHRRGAERHAEIVAVALRGLWRFLGEDVRRCDTSIDPNEMRDLRAPERTLIETDESEGLHVPDRTEIGAILRWISTAKILERDRLACMLLIYSVQRRRTVALARRADFEACAGGGVWNIPPAHRKSASTARRRGHGVGVHRVPLPQPAWEIVEKALRLAGESEWLFPAIRNWRVGQEAKTMSESTITHTFESMGLKARPHDMRRAFGTTYRLSAGLRKSDIGLVLDHGKSSDDGAAERVTSEHYAFNGGVDPEVWSIMRSWVEFVDQCVV